MDASSSGEVKLNMPSSGDHLRNDPELANLQKVDIFLQQLPYFEQSKKYGFKAFADLKRNLAESIVYNEIRPGFTHSTNQLIIFIHEYGLFFTKAEQLELIEMFIQVMQTSDIDLPTIDFCFTALFELLKYIEINYILVPHYVNFLIIVIYLYSYFVRKYDKLTRKDLVIDWKPIYKIYLRFHKINECSSELVPE